MSPPQGGQAGGVVPAVLLVLGLVAGCTVAAPAALLVVTADGCDPLAAPAGDLDDGEIPADYLTLYQQAGADYGLPWTLLAAIGHIETRHGTLDAPGVRSGANFAGAAGPMQFGIGGKAGNTWGGEPVRAVPPERVYGVDGDGDGIADVYNPADAIPAAAGYLAANGAPADLRGAVFAYNRADWYVDKVFDKAVEYADGATPAAAVPAGNRAAHCADLDVGDGAGAGPWGGHANGRIPLDQLCPIGSGHRLRCDAAAAFALMDAAYRATYGTPIPVTDSYRDLDGQERAYRDKPDLAATPGRSNHGWGLALDMAVGGWDGQLFLWLQANGPRYGWHHPPWAQKDGSKPEEWHWEYTP